MFKKSLKMIQGLTIEIHRYSRGLRIVTLKSNINASTYQLKLLRLMCGLIKTNGGNFSFRVF